MEAGNFDSGNQQQAARGQQHILPAIACCKPAATRSRQREQELSVQREGGVWHVSGVTAAANSASEMAGNCEQWLPFVVMAAGGEKKLDLGF